MKPGNNQKVQTRGVFGLWSKHKHKDLTREHKWKNMTEYRADTNNK